MRFAVERDSAPRTGRTRKRLCVVQRKLNGRAYVNAAIVCARRKCRGDNLRFRPCGAAKQNGQKEKSSNVFQRSGTALG
jgi:hypothetical protein